ncbi:MAG TPA: N-acetylmuramoyl-L-alanine amidase [Candidatus Bathyarchaeia archaeon]|nr:N-acetylmuramoyl-L-alanine amidase [Candidatus Bathyarchaeia archaeon]
MKKIVLLGLTLVALVIFGGSLLSLRRQYNFPNYGAPPYFEEEDGTEQDLGRFGNLLKWVRPEGPLRVGLQAGHWKNSELPDELVKLRKTSGGTSNGNTAEWEVNLAICKEIKKILEKEDIVVDILPATVPTSYWADAFVSIHADGSTSPKTSGFKVAAPRRDLTGKANGLIALIKQEYAKITGFDEDPNITMNMSGYYAFSWRRFEHAIHPMTPAAILETGFLTNPTEARMLIKNPQIPAQAIAQALINFLKP